MASDLSGGGSPGFVSLFEPGTNTQRSVGIRVENTCGDPGETVPVQRVAIDVEGVR
jgi:hypothetical protein